MNNQKTVSLATLGACTLLLAGVATAQTWLQLSTAGGSPPAQVGYATYDATHNRLIVFIPDNLNQVWVLTNANGLGGLATWTQLATAGSPPFGTGGGVAVYDQTTNQMIYYGGCSAHCSPALPGVYVLSNANGLGGIAAWSLNTTNPPAPRASPSAVYNPSNKRMIAFGGDLAFYGTAQNDTRVLPSANGTSSTWTTLHPSGGPPGVRTTDTAIYDEVHNRMIVFGGTDLAGPNSLTDYNDTWVLSNADGTGGTPSWTKLNPAGGPPEARRIHSAIYDSSHDTMYVFGGLDDAHSSTLGDLWKLTDVNGLRSAEPKWKQIGQLGTPPGGSYGQSVVFDEANQRMILFGGSLRGSFLTSQVFILDLLKH